MDIIRGVANGLGFGDFFSKLNLEMPRTRNNINALPDFAVNYNWVIQFPQIKPSGYVKDDGVSLSQMQDQGLITSALNKVSEALNVVKNFGEPGIEEKIFMMAKAIDLPIPTIRTNDIPFQAYKRDLPTQASLDDTTITVYDDKDLRGFYYFFTWMKNIISDQGVFGYPDASSGFGAEGIVADPLEIALSNPNDAIKTAVRAGIGGVVDAYNKGLNNYAHDIIVRVFDNMGILNGQFTLIKCFPTSIDTIRLSSDQPGLIELSIKMSVFRMHFDRGEDINKEAIGPIEAIRKIHGDVRSIYSDTKTTFNTLIETGKTVANLGQSITNIPTDVSARVQQDFVDKAKNIKNG